MLERQLTPKERLARAHQASKFVSSTRKRATLKLQIIKMSNNPESPRGGGVRDQVGQTIW